jgi:hypothetical protein
VPGVVPALPPNRQKVVSKLATFRSAGSMQLLAICSEVTLLSVSAAPLRPVNPAPLPENAEAVTVPLTSKALVGLVL